MTRVIGGRGLPIFPNSSDRDCTVDWKIEPMVRLRKRVLAEFDNATTPPVVITGIRFDESTVRGNRMSQRGESDQVRFDPKLGERRLSLICYWSEDDVWEYLGRARSGQINGYSTFEETFRIYADAAGTSCAVVADEMLKETSKSRGCGARTGCWACTAVGRDKSLENMIDGDPRYAYLRGLNRLQRFILATQWDWSRRNWVGRTIRDGYIKLEPDIYSPAMLEELLRYALTLDVEEGIAAQCEGREPRFQIVSIEQLIAVDAMWSLYGHHRPFHALKLFRDIYIEGQRYPVPEVEMVPKTPLPAARYLYVGDDWDEGRVWAYAGLRSPELELLGEQGDCIGTRVSGQKVVMNVNTEDFFTVDIESAYLVLELEMDELIVRYHDDPTGLITEGYRYYTRMGIVALAKNQLTVADGILRRTAFKSRHGFSGLSSLDDLLPFTISKEEWKRAMERSRPTAEPAEPALPAIPEAPPKPTTAQMAMF